MDHVSLALNLLEPVGHVAYRLQICDVTDDYKTVHFSEHLSHRSLVTLALRVLEHDWNLLAIFKFDFVLPYLSSGRGLVHVEHFVHFV